jgi:putative oxidoreductase
MFARVLAAHRRHLMALRGLEFVMGALFLYLGGAKLLGTPAAVRLFRDIGWGQWFRYVTGVVEVSGALVLLIPALAGASALLLMSVMVAATGIELLVLHRPPAAAMACLCAHTIIARGRRVQTRQLFARAPIVPRSSPASWCREPGSRTDRCRRC